MLLLLLGAVCPAVVLLPLLLLAPFAGDPGAAAALEPADCPAALLYGLLLLLLARLPC
jgi:hypothetical protein